MHRISQYPILTCPGQRWIERKGAVRFVCLFCFTLQNKLIAEHLVLSYRCHDWSMKQAVEVGAGDDISFFFFLYLFFVFPKIIQVQRSYAWKPLYSDRIDNDRWDRTFYISAIVVAAFAGEWFHMIAMIAALAEVFFFLSDRSDHSDGSDHMETGLNLIIAYLKRKDCLQRNFYSNCVSLWKKKALKASDVVWSVSISSVVWSSVLISVTWVELTVGCLFYVFTVMPSKIKMQTSQYRKSTICEMKEDKYTKSLAKNQVCAIIDVRDIRKNVLPKFIRLCMDRRRHDGVPLRGTNMATGNHQKHLFF